MEIEVIPDCRIVFDNCLWKEEDVGYYSKLIQYVVGEYRNLGLHGKDLPPVVVQYHDAGYPLCSVGEDCRLIFLDTEGTHWAQFVFQFAHEYCHHLIDGPMDVELISSFWLEESICEMASRYMLLKLADVWEQDCNTIGYFRNYVSAMKSYEAHRRMNTVIIEGKLSVWIQKNYEVLCEEYYHRDLYDSIAQYLLPLFIENQTLWRLLPYLKRVPESEYVNLCYWLVEVVRPQVPKEMEDAFEVFFSAILG